MLVEQGARVQRRRGRADRRHVRVGLVARADHAYRHGEHEQRRRGGEQAVWRHGIASSDTSSGTISSGMITVTYRLVNVPGIPAIAPIQ